MAQSSLPLPLVQPTLPQPPAFDRPEDERQHRKQRLAAALCLFARYGFDEVYKTHP